MSRLLEKLRAFLRIRAKPIASFILFTASIALFAYLGRKGTSVTVLPDAIAAPPLQREHLHAEPKTPSGHTTDVLDAASMDSSTADTSQQEVIVTDSGPQALTYQPDGAILVDLNLATEHELRKLPGIGAGRAKKILELRARLGRFRSVDELARIKGLGKKRLYRLKPFAKVSKP